VTWVLHYAPEGNWQSQKWHHVHSPTKKPWKFKQTHSIAKIMASVFLGAGKAFFWLTSCPVERPLMQSHIARHWRGYAVLSKIANGAYY
jgi:hypothetical protein